jgi:sortase (surface protein transpeptidase)
MEPPRPRRAKDLIPGETYVFRDVSSLAPPGPAACDPPGTALSRRKFLAFTGFATLLGLGLGGGSDLEPRDGAQFGKTLEGSPVQRDLPPAFTPAVQRLAGTPVETRVADAVGRLRVPSIGLDTGVLALDEESSGALESPPGPLGVAWYRFSGTPGASTNVVLAGHVSWHTGEPAAFRRLDELSAGGEVVVTDSLGRTFVYRVFASLEVDPAGPHVAGLLGPQQQAICTLISCGGWFDAGSHAYTKRRVVQAAL